jgi:hypothetical protein
MEPRWIMMNYRQRTEAGTADLSAEEDGGPGGSDDIAWTASGRSQQFALADTKPMPGTRSFDPGIVDLYEIHGTESVAHAIAQRILDADQQARREKADAGVPLTLMRPVSEEFRGSQGGEVGPSFTDRYLVLGFSQYTTDKATFYHWYDQEHIKQVLDAPGLRRVQRYEIEEIQDSRATSPDYGHLALYEFEAEPTPFRSLVKDLLIREEMVIPNFMVQPFTMIFLKPVADATTLKLA